MVVMCMRAPRLATQSALIAVQREGSAKGDANSSPKNEKQKCYWYLALAATEPCQKAASLLETGWFKMVNCPRPLLPHADASVAHHWKALVPGIESMSGKNVWEVARLDGRSGWWIIDQQSALSMPLVYCLSFSYFLSLPGTWP